MQITARCVLSRCISPTDAKAPFHAHSKNIDQRAHKTAPQQTANDITREVNSQVEPRPAVDQRPCDKAYGEQAAANQQAEEYGYADALFGG